VARPAPFLQAANNKVIQYVQSGAKADFIDIHGYDLQSISEGRSDRGIANYYWVQSAEWALISDMDMKLQAQAPTSVDSMLKFDYPNCSLKRYNIRRMSVKKSMGPVGVISATGRGTPEEKRQAALLGSDYLDKCRKILAESNKDNVVFESGSMRLRGNEKIKAGRYLRLKRGEKTASLYYAVSVEHEYLPYIGYSTTVNYERGTGFIDRISRQTSPYLGENNLDGFT
jgi:predicted HicB family RNase H-like nuclease